MKSQMDWIVTIVSLVLALIAAGVCFAMKPTPLTPPEPEKVETKAPEYPAGAVTFANSLSGGGGNSGAVGGGAQRGMGSGAPTMPGGATGPRGVPGPGPGGFGPPASALQGAKGRAFANGGPAMVGPGGGGGGARGGGGGGKAGPKE